MKLSQKQVFLRGEAKAWFARNQHRLGVSDPVTDMLVAHKIRPTTVLEVGASNGWRLQKLQDLYECSVDGVDPRGDSNLVFRGTADNLGFFASERFDLVIYGFCLYLVDPEDYFRIAAEGDRVLKNGGHIIIHDFWSDQPFRRRYKHVVDNPVFAHHFDPEMLWLCHPAYVSIDEKHMGEEAVHLMRKDYSNAYYEAE